eukprot:346643-Rhodomonas_salina.1
MHAQLRKTCRPTEFKYCWNNYFVASCLVLQCSVVVSAKAPAKRVACGSASGHEAHRCRYTCVLRSQLIYIESSTSGSLSGAHWSLMKSVRESMPCFARWK